MASDLRHGRADARLKAADQRAVCLHAAGLWTAMAIWIAAIAPATAQPSLSLPVDCAIPSACVVQNYTDAAPGAEARDHRCGPLSYDGHTGTDFRIRNLRAMAAGIAVRAAADGVVGGARDSEPNGVYLRSGSNRASVGDVECGNGVRLIHAGGWETLYCHLSPGLRVRDGQRVRRGEVLGVVGLSGMTEFPHLHFDVLSPARKSVDPFTGAAPESGCGRRGRGLWSPAAARVLAYRAPAVQIAGFDGAATDIPGVIEGARAPVRPGRDALVFYGRVIGLSAGDVMRVRLTGPTGFRPTQSDYTAPRARAQHMLFVGRRRPSGGFPPGSYTGSITVTRGGETVLRSVHTARLRSQ